MHLDYEDVPKQVRGMRRRSARLRSEWAATRAETEGSAALGDIVLLLRRRGRISARRSMVLFGLLIFVIVLGLGYYLGLPFLQQVAGSARATLTDTRDAILAEQTALDRERAALLTGPGSPSLASALELTATRIEMEYPADLMGDATDGNNVLIYGSRGTLLRSTDSGDSFVRLQTAVSDLILGASATSNRILIYTRDGTVLRSTDGGARFEQVVEGTGTGLLGDSTAAERVLLYGFDGTVLRSTDGGASFQTVGTGTEALLMGDTTLGDRILIYGFGGVVLRSTDGGASFDRVRTGTREDLMGSYTFGDTILIYGGEGTILRSTDGGASFTSVPTPNVPRLTGHIAVGDTILIHGMAGILLRSTDGGQSFDVVVTGTDADLIGASTFRNGILIFGREGRILRSSDDGVSFAPVDAASVPSLNGHFSLGDLLFLYGNNGSIFELDDGWRQAALDLALEDGPRGDVRFATFLDDTLPERIIAGSREVFAVSAALNEIIAKRNVVLRRLEAVEDDLAQLDDVPQWLLDLQAEREDFAAFMATCRGVTNWSDPPEPRGVTDADPDAITLACTEAYRQQLLADEANFWETLAQQVPPGILLLFLLATLGGLYRYNMRMAGFHHSRADALEAMSLGFAKEDWDEVVRLSEALAADKVAFGKGNTPSDQAVEIAKTIVNRSK